MKTTIFIVDEKSPAFNFMKGNLLKKGIKPGQIYPCTAEELEAWRKDVVLVDLHISRPENQK